MIVLDTNVLSEVTKLAISDFPAQRRERLAKWIPVKKALERARYLHAILCPETPTLDRELVLTEFGPAIKEVLKALSGGTRYLSRDEIEVYQLHEAAIGWRNGNRVQRVERRDVISGEINEWQNIFHVSVDLGFRNNPAVVKEARDRLHQSASVVFDLWSSTTKTIEQIFNDERRAYGPLLVERFCKGLQRMVRGEVAFDDFLDPTRLKVRQVQSTLEKLETAQSASLAEAVSFFASDHAADIPSNRISAALYAYEARQMAGDMKRPKASMWLDIEMLAAALPYCDAVLIESHFAGALNAMRKILPKECGHVRVFSVRQLPEFVRYLDHLSGGVPDEQRRVAETLYMD